MKASDVTDTLELALQASGCNQVNVRHRPRLLSDNGASYIATELAEWLDGKGMEHVRGAPYHPQTQGKIASQRLQANACRPAEKMAPDPEEPHPSGKLLPPRRSQGADRQVHQPLQSQAISREPAKPDNR